MTAEGNAGVKAADADTAASASASADAAVSDGLTEAEASQRLARADRPRGSSSSRSYASIVRANVVTVFNVILAGFGILTLIFGDARDALFLGITVANVTIGVTQEVRAKRALDRLSLLVAPRARLRRDGVLREIDVEEVVLGDLVAEGRRARRNLQRVTKLYVTQSALAAFLILTVGTSSDVYPLLPRHLSLAASLTIGIPTFFLALAPSSGPWQPEGFVAGVARFAVPAGVMIVPGSSPATCSRCMTSICL